MGVGLNWLGGLAGVLVPGIAKIRLDCGGWSTRLSEAYNSAQTTQLPAGTVVNAGKRRISRLIGFADREVTYETSR